VRARAGGRARGPAEHAADPPKGATKPDRTSELHPPPIRTEWIVQPGDTLWDIAAQVLESQDQARIARYWPAIHRANRAVIGANPNLILPGQILKLPQETGR
jgi:nucleoid-associated protein YgaU